MITKLRPLTIADWDAMPYSDGNRYEIIEGELFVSCSPGLTHERVLIKLVVLIGNFLETNPIGVAVLNVGVILSNVSGVIPDMIVFLNEQRDTIITNDRVTGPPALVIEILSPGGREHSTRSRKQASAVWQTRRSRVLDCRSNKYDIGEIRAPGIFFGFVGDARKRRHSINHHSSRFLL